LDKSTPIVKNRILVTGTVLMVVIKIWLRFSMSDLSDHVDKLTKDYEELKTKLEYHRAFRDSLMTDLQFRTQVMDSITSGEIKQKREIEKTLEQYNLVLADRDRLANRLTNYEIVNNVVTGLIVIILITLGVGQIRRP